MSRYIDADVLIDDLIHNRSFYPALVASAIKNTPTADVVEVVRCKDCKNCIESEKTNRLFCIYHYEGYIEVFENEFCSCGERKEENEG